MSRSVRSDARARLSVVADKVRSKAIARSGVPQRRSPPSVVPDPSEDVQTPPSLEVQTPPRSATATGLPEAVVSQLPLSGPERKDQDPESPSSPPVRSSTDAWVYVIERTDASVERAGVRVVPWIDPASLPSPTAGESNGVHYLNDFSGLTATDVARHLAHFGILRRIRDETSAGTSSSSVFLVVDRAYGDPEPFENMDATAAARLRDRVRDAAPKDWEVVQVVDGSPFRVESYATDVKTKGANKGHNDAYFVNLRGVSRLLLYCESSWGIGTERRTGLRLDRTKTANRFIDDARLHSYYGTVARAYVAHTDAP